MSVGFTRCVVCTNTFVCSFCQIVNKILQFRYNLGSGESLVQMNSVSIADNRFYTVVIRREEQAVEMVVDGAYVNRTRSPGSEATLDIPITSIYLGASVDVQDDTFTNGFSGCIRGARLDRKELPAGGGENQDFTTVMFSSGVKSGCPIGTLEESPQPMSYVYIAIGVAIPVLLIIVFVFVIICVLAQWRWNQTREHTVNFRRGGRGGGGSRGDSGQNGFQWQPSSFRLTDMSSPHGTYKTGLDSPDHQQTRFGQFNFDNVSATNAPPANVPIPTVPVTEVHVSESTVTVNERAVDVDIEDDETSLVEQPSRSASTRRRNRVSPPVEGFTLVSQANPGYLEESPETVRSRKFSEPQEGFHIRSPSGHQSLGSITSDATTVPPAPPLPVLDFRDFRAVHKRVEVANNDNEQKNIDEMKHFKEEGSFQSMGSIGSLLDFLKDVDRETNGESPSRVPRSVPQTSTSVEREAPPKKVPTKKNSKRSRRKVDEKNRRNDERTNNGSKFTKTSSKTKLISEEYRPNQSKPNNILERFHNEMFGHRPTPIETSALV